ncbi:MAG: NTP transferase domain-containing protein [Ruminococcus bromii]|jgi:bifunctional UDP-N-acetylglucosamine pyrophosphorylase/glucosamine-1-phosphate N-acetyltransferase|uniref:sugar phosphate nucleotidyltransferase n=1 Tax=Ruminococcus sp. YE282 TaxID=3158780 RepID=UPI000889BA60|nr:NTP transferase domain-containing protein [Ruminococcus bromii]HCB94971.1 cytidylyltransferase [Ruminococcus sp.]MDD6433040.1 sugar phosphate nucleotidyltransferase [Ruminococcus bromii]MDY4084180.1 sugar phosphate nucleotidyltransferase [Ruminococcus bromii]MDY4711075.1 sugar phosphate nucleotidyltransferase [Ruminococcus bromii]
MNNCAIILAGGEGKRMKSDKPKTLSMVLNKPMLLWVISALKGAGIDDICIVKGYKKECIEDFIDTLDFEVESVFQAERLGTGHAVMMAKEFLKKHSGNVVILNGDAPFMTSDTIKKSLDKHIESQSSATVISAKVDNPTGYGRIVRGEDGSLKAIVEQKDADEETLKINEVNSGGFWFDCQLLLSVLDRIKSNNKAGEYYLPDAIKLLLSDGKKVEAYTAECSDTVLGANDPAQLEELNQIAKQKGYTCSL